MNVLTFQNYRVLDYLMKDEIFKRTVSKECIKEEWREVIIDNLTKCLSDKVGYDVEEPIVGICDIDLPSIFKICSKNVGALETFLDVTGISPTSVLLELDIPDEKLITYSQEVLYPEWLEMVRGEDIHVDIKERLLEKPDRGFFKCCVSPYIKKEWVKKIYYVYIATNVTDAPMFYEVNWNLSEAKMVRVCSMGCHHVSNDRNYFYTDLAPLNVSAKIAFYDKAECDWELLEEFGTYIYIRNLNLEMMKPIELLKKWD